MTPAWVTFARHQERRFWSKVKKGPSHLCWPWLGGRDKDGYGKFAITLPRVGGKNPQKHMRAHRLAFILTNGFTTKLLRHTCDVEPCCNPDHLRTGTQADNRQDCVERGRQLRGEQSGRSKLTGWQVGVIRQERGKTSCRVLAVRFNVCPATISHVWSGRNWKKF